MFAPMSPKTERARIRTEREYREWQMSLQGIVPAKRKHSRASLLARMFSLITR